MSTFDSLMLGFTARATTSEITVDGEEIARLRVDPVALESRLRGTSVA